MNKTPTEEAWESLATLVAETGAHWRLTDSPADDCVDVPVADLRLALADRSRLQAERDRAVAMNAVLAEAVRWRQTQITRGILNMTDAELTDARVAQKEAFAALSTLPPPVKEAEPEPVAWTNELQVSKLRIAPKEASRVWGRPNGSINIPLYATPPALQARIEALEKVIENLLAHTEGVQLPTTAHIMRARAKAALHPKEGAGHGG